MDFRRQRNLAYGFLCLAIGSIWLFHTMEVLPPRLSAYVSTWRFLLLVLGSFVFVKDKRFGSIILIVGTVATIAYFWILPTGWQYFLPPTALILFGLSLVLRSLRRKKLSLNDEHALNHATVFGRFHYKVNSLGFKGGYLTSFFGNSVVDFTAAQLDNAHATLRCNSIFGNATIIVPQDWVVKIKTVNIFASAKDRRSVADALNVKESTLIISGLSLFGSVKIQG